MAGAAGKSFRYLLVLSLVFLLLPFSVMCNDLEQLNQVLIKENLTIRYNLTFHYLAASFGGPLLDKKIEFHVSVATNRNVTCHIPIDPPAIKDNMTAAQSWIVVIQHNADCLYVQEVRNAQVAGYQAAIIYGSKNRLDRMVGDDAYDINIPAFYIGQDDGMNLTNEYFQAEKHGQKLLLSMELNGFDLVYSSYEIIVFIVIIPFVGFAGILVFGFLIAALHSKLSFNRRRNKVLAGLLPLSTVPTMELKSVKCGDPHYETCAICIKDFVKGDEARTLHCSHAYHCTCIDPWLVKHRTNCPLCNQSVANHSTSVVTVV